MITTITAMKLQLGPDLTEQEWAASLQRHREAKIEELRGITVTDQRYAEIERAARGLFWSDVVARVQ